MSGDGFQIHNTGVNVSGGSQLNQGQTVNAELSNIQTPVTLEALFGKMADAIPVDVRQSVQTEVLWPLKEIAYEPAEKQSTDQAKAQSQTLLERLRPYGPAILQSIMVFGEAALNALATRNPLVAGVLAVCRRANADRDLSK